MWDHFLNFFLYFYNIEDLSYTWLIDLIRLLGSGHLVGSQWGVAAPARRNRVSEVMIDFQLWKEVLLPGGRSSLSKWATGMGLRRRPRRWPLLIAAQSAGPTWSRISLVMESSEETRVLEWLHFVLVPKRPNCDFSETICGPLLDYFADDWGTLVDYFWIFYDCTGNTLVLF